MAGRTIARKDLIILASQSHSTAIQSPIRILLNLTTNQICQLSCPFILIGHVQLKGKRHNGFPEMSLNAGKVFSWRPECSWTAGLSLHYVDHRWNLNRIINLFQDRRVSFIVSENNSASHIIRSDGRAAAVLIRAEFVAVWISCVFQFSIAVLDTLENRLV